MSKISKIVQLLLNEESTVIRGKERVVGIILLFLRVEFTLEIVSTLHRIETRTHDVPTR